MHQSTGPCLPPPPPARRNLLYTAITRAKRLVVLVGTQQAIGIAVGNDEVGRRYSRLAERLAGGVGR